jgi:CRP-like cAMP-binding protein
VTYKISQNYIRKTNELDASVLMDTVGGRTVFGKDAVQNIRPFPERRVFINKLLAALPQPALDRISRYLKPVSLRRDEYIYQPDDQVDFVYFPQSAVFSGYQMLNDGRTIEIALTGCESAIGIPSVFSRCRATDWTQVCTAGTALKIDSEIFRAVAALESPVKALLNDQINSYIRQISNKVICNTHHSVEERLCTWLLMLEDRCGTASLKLTQEQIARVLGVFRPSVTCIAQNLRERGLIDYVRGRITLRDRTELIKAACSCYSEFRVDCTGRITIPSFLRQSHRNVI